MHDHHDAGDLKLGLKTQNIASLAQAFTLPQDTVALTVLALEQGVDMAGLTLISEQDVLGDRLVRQRKHQRAAKDVLQEASSLSAGDLVVHVEHGIGRFIGLRIIEAAGAPHDCLELHYAGGDRLFLPVENLELLSRYGGADHEDSALDKLGGLGWQTRKARLKKRIREIAESLVKLAAERQLRPAPKLIPPDGLFDEFCARFPYEETQDQGSPNGSAHLR